MKHFLRLLFIGSVLFVLLGLFQQSQDDMDSGRLAASGLEQIFPDSGILTQQQDLPSPVPFSTDSPPPGFTLKAHCNSQKSFHSLHSKQELQLYKLIFEDMKPDLFFRTGFYLNISSRNNIRS